MNYKEAGVDVEKGDLFVERMKLVERIGLYKMAHDIPVFQPSEYGQKTNAIIELAKEKGIDEALLKQFYDMLHDTSIKVQEEQRK